MSKPLDSAEQSKLICLLQEIMKQTRQDKPNPNLDTPAHEETVIIAKLFRAAEGHQQKCSRLELATGLG